MTWVSVRKVFSVAIFAILWGYLTIAGVPLMRQHSPWASNLPDGYREICVQLKRVNQSQFADFYTAAREGYYASPIVMFTLKKNGRQGTGTGTDHTLAYAGYKDQGWQLAQLVRTIPYIHTGKVPLGLMEYAAWSNISSITLTAGLVSRMVGPKGLFTDVCLKAIYGGKAP